MAQEHKEILSRRAFVGRAATATAGAAVALSAVSVGRAAAAPRPHEPAEHAPSVEPQAPQAASAPVDTAPQMQIVESGPAPWEIVAPLAVGSTVGDGWKIAGLTAVRNGSSVLTLANDRGREHRIHLCRNDGDPQGLVYTDRFDLVVMNGGRGDLPTEESFGQAVAAVAHAIAANEARHGHVLANLMPQSERLQRFASAAELR